MHSDLRLFRLIPLILLAGLGFGVLSGAVAAAPTPADAATQHGTAPAAASPADTQQLIDALKDPTRRDALIAALENLQKTAPAAAPAAPAKPAGPLQPNGLGAQLVTHGALLANTVSESALMAARGVANVPDLVQWLRDVVQDPAMLRSGAIAAGRLLCVILLALGGEFLAWRLVHRFYDSLAADARHQHVEKQSPDPAGRPAPQPEGWLLLHRLPIIAMALTVDLLPTVAFFAVSILVLATPVAGSADARSVTLAVVYAYVIIRVVGSFARAIFGAPTPRLRLLPAGNDAAHYLMIWVRRIAVTVVFGYALSQIASLFGMAEETQEGLLRLISLLVHVMLIIMVLQCRVTVTAWLGGTQHGRFSVLRYRIARVWHIYAIVFIAGAWIVYAAEIRDGFERLLRFMLASILVALSARVLDIVLTGVLDRGFSLVRRDDSRFARIAERAARYHWPLRLLLRATIVASAFVALFQAWGLDAIGWFSRDALGSRLIGLTATLVLTLGVALALWDALNVAMQIYLDELAHEGAVVRAARLRTIVPLLRNALLIALMVLIVLTALSELGVNIGPLLAGASIFGVALGFGSQKLVQDFITGIFLLAENAMQVGDNVTAGGLSGTVEYLSIRTLRLRAGDGSVHLIPFSSVSTVTNSNRGLGNAAVSVTIDYDEDTDRVGAVLAKVVTEMRGEKDFSAGMLSDLQLWGVDRVDGTTVTLAGQIVCTDGARWAVQREFNRRIKLAFQKEGIRLSPPISVSAFRHPLDVRVEPPPAAEQREGRPNGDGAARPARL